MMGRGGLAVAVVVGVGAVVALSTAVLLDRHGDEHPVRHSDSHDRRRSDRDRFDVPLDADARTVQLFDSLSLDRVVQWSRSPCGDWVAFCRVVEGGEVDLFRMHRHWEYPERITATPSLEFDPDIDGRGVVAYARHDHRVVESALVLDGMVIQTGAELHKALCLSDRRLLAHGSRLSTSGDEHWLVVVDRESGRSQLIVTPLVISSIEMLGDGRYLLKGHCQSSGAAATVVYDSATGGLGDSAVSPRGDLDASIGREAIRERLLELATIHLLSNEPLNSLADGNNHLGRLSWRAAYRLEGLVDLLAAGISHIGGISVESLAIGSARSLVKRGIEDPDKPGWPSRKYSIRQDSELNLLVNDAAILLPLLRYLNISSSEDQSLIQAVVRLAELVFERNEPLFDPMLGAAGGYRFESGSDTMFDGVCVPFNQQNLWGSALVELYDLTGEYRFMERALSLARSLHAEMEVSVDGRLVWNYWPECFLRGWAAADLISTNTPQRKPTTSPWPEDVFHASINVDFMRRIIAVGGDSPFSNAELAAMKKTLRDLRLTGSEWSLRVSGGSGESIGTEVGSARFRPGRGWVQLDPMWLTEQYLDGWPSWYPYFEEDPFVVYASLLAALGESVTQASGVDGRDCAVIRR